jgi:hypothetical protein
MHKVQPGTPARIRTARASVDADLIRVDALQVGHLMTAPLAQLVDELDVALTESSITEAGFTGYCYAGRHGITIALPPNRSETEHDCVARYLIGRAFNVEGLPPLPELFQVHDIATDEGRKDK